MTCQQIRIVQLDQLKSGIAEVAYFVSELSRSGSFLPIRVHRFDTLEDALDKYSELSRFIPSGFIRIHAEFDISPYDFRR